MILNEAIPKNKKSQSPIMNKKDCKKNLMRKILSPKTSNQNQLTQLWRSFKHKETQCSTFHSLQLTCSCKSRSLKSNAKMILDNSLEILSQSIWEKMLLIYKTCTFGALFYSNYHMSGAIGTCKDMKLQFVMFSH